MVLEGHENRQQILFLIGVAILVLLAGIAVWAVNGFADKMQEECLNSGNNVFVRTLAGGGMDRACVSIPETEQKVVSTLQGFEEPIEIHRISKLSGLDPYEISEVEDSSEKYYCWLQQSGEYCTLSE